MALKRTIRRVLGLLVLAGILFAGFRIFCGYATKSVIQAIDDAAAIELWICLGESLEQGQRIVTIENAPDKIRFRDSLHIVGAWLPLGVAIANSYAIRIHDGGEAEVIYIRDGRFVTHPRLHLLARIDATFMATFKSLVQEHGKEIPPWSELTGPPRWVQE